MVKSFEEGKIDSFGCLIHSIQLLIEEMILKLKSVKSIIRKCRKLASASNQGMKFNQELKWQQALEMHESIGNPAGFGKGTGFGLRERDRDGIGLGHYWLRASSE